MRSIQRRKQHTKLLIIIFVVTALLFAVGAAIAFSLVSSAPKGTHKTKSTSIKKQTPTLQPTDKIFDKKQYSLTDPASIWVIVNKKHPLNPVDYVPSDLVSSYNTSFSAKMADALKAMITTAQTQGITLRVLSGYRSYTQQTNLYNSYVAQDGQMKADRYSARPGHSEHQTGLAVDLGGVHGCDVQACFNDIMEGKWLLENAHTHGFIIRYSAENQAVTGYDPEPWHLRFVGIDLAREIKNEPTGSLEDFFNVSGGASY